MKRKQTIWIGVLLFLALVLLGPLVAFPKLQMKLDQEINKLESYKAIPSKSLEWHGRNAYLSVPEGMDTALIVNAMNDMKALRGVRDVGLSYVHEFDEIQEEAEPMAETTSEEIASTTSAPETEPPTEAQSTMAEITTVSAGEAASEVQEVMDELHSFSAMEFDFGTAELTEGSKEAAKEIAEVLKAYPDVLLKVTGHTDSIGTDQNNKVISLARAQAVVDELIIHGITADRLIAEGKGEVEPIASNETKEGRKLNRRVVLTGLEN